MVHPLALPRLSVWPPLIWLLRNYLLSSLFSMLRSINWSLFSISLMTVLLINYLFIGIFKIPTALYADKQPLLSVHPLLDHLKVLLPPLLCCLLLVVAVLSHFTFQITMVLLRCISLSVKNGEEVSPHVEFISELRPTVIMMN